MLILAPYKIVLYLMMNVEKPILRFLKGKK